MNTVKGMKTFTLISFLFVVVFVSTLIWFQSLQPNIASAQSSTQLTLQISTSQKKYLERELQISTSQNKYLQREPIPINFKLSNQTSVPITWNGFFKVGGPNINLITRMQNGSEIRWNGKDHEIETIIVGNEVTKPNRDREEENLIDEYLVQKLFPLPGRYELRVEFVYISAPYGQLQTDTIVSNPIIIDIDEPRGNDRKAYDYLKNTYDPINERGNVREIVQAEQYFVDNFRGSAYWKYITYRLATTYPIFGEYEKAEREFLKITDLDFYYTKKIENEFNEIVRKLGRDKRNPRRQPSSFPNLPIARPGPVPSVVPVPFPNNPPVLIPIPNPTP